MMSVQAEAGPLPSRRSLLLGGSAIVAAGALPAWGVTASAEPALWSSAEAFPLDRVRLQPSPYLDAVEANHAYLLRLEPDRLLHNFRTNAGLQPRGEIYGGWESDTIAGHTLGHYLSAVSLMYAQTGDEEMKRRALYIVDEIAACQAANGDGYVGALMRKKDDKQENGKVIWGEIKRGDIRSQGFDLNGSWSPLYTVHKLYAGLYDAQDWCGADKALPIAVALTGYFADMFDALSEEQLQTVLDCEHGGINESFAELYARTKNPRWLKLAERIRHKKVLDPLAAGENSLPWIHANTQIPKVIGLARLYELTGEPRQAAAPRFFWDTVVNDYTYVIGGNADREYFPAPRTVSKHITEQTCESCNTYNMLKLTRHLYAWKPQAALFDYYERGHINHILAQEDPKTGMFAYMVPLMSGEARNFSTPFDDFWCCVGSGMESHSKHGESIWWKGGDGDLVVNLFIPSRLDWRERKAAMTLETGYPFDAKVDVTVSQMAEPQTFAVALRVPGWAKGAAVSVNGKREAAAPKNGYAVVRRQWRAGDKITLDLPLQLRTESTNDDSQVIALLRGPVVLAADMGPADKPFDGPAPALVSNDVLRGFKPVDEGRGLYRAVGIGRPGDMDFAPFYQQRDRRTAVYFRKFTDAQWKVEQVEYARAQARERDLAARSVDVMHLGEMQPERDHGLTSKNSYPASYRGRHGRDARAEGYFEFRMKVRPGPLVLQASYWGEERKRRFDILVDGTRVATQALEGNHPGEFFDVDYPVPEALTRGKSEVTVRFQPSSGETRCGPVFGVRLYTAAKPVSATTA